MKQTIIHVIEDRLKNSLEEVPFCFLPKGEEVEFSMDYATFCSRTKQLAKVLQYSCKKGDRVMILLPSGLDYITSFFACLYAGVIAVPLYPPRRNKNDRRLDSISQDCDANVILSLSDIKRSTITPILLQDNMKWVCLDEIETNAKELDVDLRSISLDDIALLQYTSGSTGAPKGVMISHRNIMSNALIMYVSYNSTPNERSVSWLPLFHDMGLIYGLCATIYNAHTLYLLPSQEFIRKPKRWMQIVTDYKINTAGGPNFSFDMLLNLTEEEEANLDLSSLKRFFCGAEPINYNTLRGFEEKFERVGFNKGVLFPCYGLAEGTLQITGNGYDEPITIVNVNAVKLQKNSIEFVDANHENAYTLVSCGRTWEDTRVKIVDSQNFEEKKEGGLGEIWASGSTIAVAYWNKPILSEAIFHAKIKNDKTGTNYLRTGDLGFLYEGLLYVTGRIKDLIIIRGSNYYPNDIEQLIQETVPDIHTNGVYAVSINDDGVEKLILLVEIARTAVRSFDQEILKKEIMRNLFLELGLRAKDIRFVFPMSLPRTSSGKKERLNAKSIYLEKTLREL